MRQTSLFKFDQAKIKIDKNASENENKVLDITMFENSEVIQRDEEQIIPE